MFHVHLGVLDDDHNAKQGRYRSLRAWESKFSSDPLVYESSRSSDQISDPQEVPELMCELNLFRDYAGLLEGVPFDILPAQRGCRLLLLGLPVLVALDTIIGDKLDDIKHFSVLRRADSSDVPEGDFDRSLMLLFHDQHRADAFYRDWHLQFFNVNETLGGPVCYLVFVDKVKIDFSSNLPVPLGSQQIPSCPFCIERIDVNISGVITSRRGWLSGDSMLASSGCVACVAQQLKEPSCMICGQDQFPLWVCLLCGHLGCGRYAKGDAWSHFQSSQHRLSLELASGRIWDYHSDMFVHRRLAACGGILDLPERVDKSSLPVHPQVSFQEDIRELDTTMAAQLEHERSKYEEACTQLRMLGTSRVQAEESLLEQDREQEKSLRASLKQKNELMNEWEKKISEKSKLVQKIEKEINLQIRKNKVMKDKLAVALAKPLEAVSCSKSKELEILENEAQKLRIKLDEIFNT